MRFILNKISKRTNATEYINPWTKATIILLPLEGILKKKSGINIINKIINKYLTLTQEEKQKLTPKQIAIKAGLTEEEMINLTENSKQATKTSKKISGKYTQREAERSSSSNSNRQPN